MSTHYKHKYINIVKIGMAAMLSSSMSLVPQMFSLPNVQWQYSSKICPLKSKFSPYMSTSISQLYTENISK